MLRRKTKVLIVDDSAIVRKVVAALLRRQSDIEVVGAAADAYEAKEQIITLRPDVLLLDLDMPRMDGLTFLKILMRHNPMPVVILSYLTRSGTTDAMDCVSAGAIDVMGKPSNDQQLATLGDALARKLIAAAQAKIVARPAAKPAPRKRAKAASRAARYDPRQLILLGASTGGTEALKEVLLKLPADLPGILIVQHIPPEFSRAFAERVNRSSALEVREAADGDAVRPGLALVAPGDYHMTVDWVGGRYVVRLNQKDPIWHQRPAVDVLFDSAVKCCGERAVAGILTGMGRDGAAGLLKLRKKGAFTLGQDEETSAVYGMPKAAMDCGAVLSQVSLWQIAPAIEKAALLKSQQAVAN